MLLRKRRHDPEGFPLAMTISALAEVGLADVWSKIEQLVDWRKSDGWFDHNRKTQSRFWFKEEIRQGLLSMLDKEEVKEEFKEEDISYCVILDENGEVETIYGGEL